MIYYNDNIKKYVELNNIKLDIEEYGIYLITGENGCGKTTLLEQILFDNDNSHFIFYNESEKKTFKKNKHNLFAYVSQNTPYLRMCVKDYIVKMNSNIDKEQIVKFLDRFSLPNSILDEKFCDLSGGEQKKITIITAFLKDTPYIFLDEPTNYMDGTSVRNFAAILEEEAINKRIIIITHDPRLTIKCKKEIIIENRNVISKHDCDNACLNTINARIPNNAKPSLMVLLMKYSMNLEYILVCVMVCVVLVAVLLLTNISFDESIGNATGKYNNSIFIYYTGGGHDSLNETYERAEHIHVNKSDYEKYISYKDISKIAESKIIKEIFIPDNCYIDKLKNCIEQGKTDNKSVFACPNNYIIQYLDVFGDLFALSYTVGAIPQDGKREVAISPHLLIEYYGYNEETVNDAIGDIIVIEDYQYVIVGFCYYDIIVVSYQKDCNYGFYCYDKNSYEKFCDEQMNYIHEIDGFDAVNDILILVDDCNEKKLLDYLIEYYPSNCYLSKYFELSFFKQQKFEVFRKWLIINIIIMMFFSIIIWYIINKSMNYSMNIIYDVGNYYVNRKYMMKKYIIIQFIIFGLIGAMVCYVNRLYSQFYYLTNYYVLLNCLILYIPVFLSCKKGYDEVKK